MRRRLGVEMTNFCSLQRRQNAIKSDRKTRAHAADTARKRASVRARTLKLIRYRRHACDPSHTHTCTHALVSLGCQLLANRVKSAQNVYVVYGDAIRYFQHIFPARYSTRVYACVCTCVCTCVSVSIALKVYYKYIIFIATLALAYAA